MPVARRAKDAILNRYPLIVITGISSLLPAIWLRGGLVISYAESGFTFLADPVRLLNLTRYIWWDAFGLGVVNVRALPSAFYHLVTSLLRFVGIPAIGRQYLIFAAILLISALAMYALAMELMEGDKFAGLLAGVFYILNPFAMNYVWHRFVSSMFGLPLMPLVLLVVVKLVKQPSYKYAFYLAGTTSLFSINAINPAYLLPVLFPSLLYTVLNTVQAPKFAQWRYLGLGALLAGGSNFWWILPFLQSLGHEVVRAGTSLSSQDTLTVISQWTPLVFVFRLLDSATSHWYGVSYRPGWIEFSIPALAMVAILLGRKKKSVLFFALLLISGLFLSKGLQPPGGAVFGWLFSHSGFFQMFRNPIEKFGIIVAFSYSFLVPLGISQIWQTSSHRLIRYVLVGVLLVLVFGASVWPMWTGAVFSFWKGAIPEGAKNIPSPRVKTPTYWKQAATYVNRDNEVFRTIFLPQSRSDSVWYDWESGYAGADFGSVDMLFDGPVISQTDGDVHSEKYRKMVLAALQGKGLDSSATMLGLMNVRYILIRNDVNESSSKTAPLAEVRRIVESAKAVEKVRSFGRLDLFRMKDEFFVPRVYGATRPVTFSEGFADPDVMTATDKELSNAYAFFPPGAKWTRGIPSLRPTYEKGTEPPAVLFKRINPTMVRVEVREALAPFYLVFLESFHPGWKVYEGNVSWPKTLLKDALPPDRHSRVNGYANAWYVSKRGDFELTLYFWPQNLVYIGAIVSILTLSAAVGFLFFHLKRTAQHSVCLSERARYE